MEIMAFDELVKVHAQKLGRDAKMATEVKALHKGHHAIFVSRVL